MDATEMHYAVENHGNDAGRIDYAERLHNVQVCGFGVEWLRPAAEACAAYLQAQGPVLICNDIGVPVERWTDCAATWVAAFCVGYEAAASAAARDGELTTAGGR